MKKDIAVSNNDSLHKKEVLLALLPFWTPQIPPLGISCLKSFLQHYNYNVKAVDVNVNNEFKDIYNKYFNLLKDYVPRKKKGNFYNIGNDVLQDHMMAHLEYVEKKEYIELIKIIVSKTFFYDLNTQQILELNEIVNDFFIKLQTYFLNLLDDLKPSVLGLSVYSCTLPASLFIFRLVKNEYPNIQTYMGGGVFADRLKIGSPDFDFFMEKTPYIDKIIIGEGEILFLKLLRGEIPSSKRVYTIEDINGEILDLNSADVPDFSDFDIQYYPYLSSYASRSCPFQCKFCSETIQWGKYRKKNGKQVVEELKKLYEKYREQLFFMGDSLLNPIVTDLAKAFLLTDLLLYWDGYLRVDRSVCDIENTLLWRRGGLYRVRLGLESGSQRILDSMGKRITIRQIQSSLAALAYAGIKTTTYWIIGYPGEKEDDFQQTLNLIEELRTYIYEAECNPFHFYLTGQANSNEWAKQKKAILLYPGKARDMLIAQTWIMDCEPSREETYNRVTRFVEHCEKLGIPNPYSLNEIYKADERWKKLHKNAVPSLVDFKNNDVYFDENRTISVKNFSAVKDLQLDDEDWDF